MHFEILFRTEYFAKRNEICQSNNHIHNRLEILDTFIERRKKIGRIFLFRLISDDLMFNFDVAHVTQWSEWNGAFATCNTCVLELNLITQWSEWNGSFATCNTYVLELNLIEIRSSGIISQ